jgi:hypothetical protein
MPLPFILSPNHWGLQGKDLKRAKAHHYLNGRELEIALNDIEFDDKDSPEYKLALLEIDYKFKKISERDYKKERATVIGEPYFCVLNGEYNQTGPEQGTMSFELDWNEEFVHELRRNGWTGVTADSIVDHWFEDSCKQMFEEESLASMEDTPITSYNRTRRKPLNGDKTEYS